MAIDWNTIYTQKWNDSQKDYSEAEAAYKKAQADEQKALDQSLAAGRTQLANTRDEALRQSYITKRQNEREMPALLKANGINGGASETSAASLLRNYQNSRNSANNSYTQGDTDLTNNYNQNTAALGSRYNTLLAELLQKRKDDTWNQTQFAYNAAQQEEEIARQKAQQEEEKRRWEIQLQLDRDKLAEETRRWEAEMEFQRQQAAAAAAASSGGGYSGGGGYYSGGGSGSGSSGRTSSIYKNNVTPANATNSTKAVNPMQAYAQRANASKGKTKVTTGWSAGTANKYTYR